MTEVGSLLYGEKNLVASQAGLEEVFLRKDACSFLLSH